MALVVLLALCVASAFAGYPKYTDYYGPNVYGGQEKQRRPTETYRPSDKEQYGNRPDNDYGYKPTYRQAYPQYDQDNRDPPNAYYPNLNVGGNTNYQPIRRNYGGSRGGENLLPNLPQSPSLTSFPSAGLLNNYPQASVAQPSLNKYPQPNYPQPNYPQPNYPQPNYPQPSYPQPNYPQPNLNDYQQQPRLNKFAQNDLSYAAPNLNYPSYPQKNPGYPLAAGGYPPQGDAYPRGGDGYVYPKEEYPQTAYPGAGLPGRSGYYGPRREAYPPQVSYPKAAYPTASYKKDNYPRNDRVQDYANNKNNYNDYDNQAYPGPTAYPDKNSYEPSQTNFYPPRLVYPIRDERQGKGSSSSSSRAFPSYDNFKIPGFAFGKLLFKS